MEKIKVMMNEAVYNLMVCRTHYVTTIWFNLTSSEESMCKLGVDSDVIGWVCDGTIRIDSTSHPYWYENHSEDQKRTIAWCLKKKVEIEKELIKRIREVERIKKICVGLKKEKLLLDVQVQRTRKKWYKLFIGA